MRYSICIQAGHQNVTTGATGAPGEQANNIRMRDKLSQVLLSKKNADGTDAFTVQLVDANPADASIDKDYNLFLALHCDADVYGTGGGFVDHPEPSTDLATVESQRIDLAIEGQYFNHSGIVNHPERSNANTKFYYMWARLSAKTPCVIVEMGVAQDAHDKVILADENIVPNALARGICSAFNIVFDPVNPPTPPSPPPPVAVIDYKSYLQKIKSIAYGKGYVWVKLNNIKTLLTQSGV